MESIREELGNQTYQFEPDRVARMLSPKLIRPRQDGKYASHPSLNDFDCLIDEPTVTTAMQKLPKLEFTDWNSLQSGDHTPMAAFLTRSVEEGDKVYDAIHQNLPKNSRFTVVERTKRLLPQLCFIKYGKETGDEIPDSYFPQPDIVGVVDGSETMMQNIDDVSCWWRLKPADITDTSSLHNYQIMIPVCIRDDWRDVALHSGTYARCMLAASPLRNFSLVIGVNYKAQTLRFLIFHRGGLSACEEIKLNSSDCGAFQKLLLSVLLWQSVEDAGIPTFTDGENFVFPESLGLNGTWKIKRVPREPSSMCGRGTYVVVVESPKNDTDEPMDTRNELERHGRLAGGMDEGSHIPA